MIRLTDRPQRTISRPAELCGVGFLSGADVRLRFVPAVPDTGLAFVRTDLPIRNPIPATAENVTGTQRRTSLGRTPLQVTLVEHVLAALSGLRIDNCIIEINAAEPPGLDGSARGFVDALVAAGIECQSAAKSIWGFQRSTTVRRDGATLTVHPADGDELQISYLLDYGLRSPIGRQTHTQTITPQTVINELAPCRTFLLEEEAHAFRRQGIGSRTTARDLLVFGPRGLIDNELRFADEPARHKILDLIGDLALTGLDLRGHIVAYRSGHPLNVELARTLAQRKAVPTGGWFRKAA